MAEGATRQAATAPTTPQQPGQPAFRWTDKQVELGGLMVGPFRHVLAVGGGRSGKSARIVRQVIMRALKAPGSRHLITRLRFNHLRASIVNGTFPWVMEKCFPGVTYRLDKLDWFARIETQGQPSEIWFAGLDEKERTEKVLGMEFATIFANECSQIPYSSILLVRTRLAQKVLQVDGRQLPLKMFYDENPPSKAHWSYKVFIQKRDPDSGSQLPEAAQYAWMRLNPVDNAENLPQETIDEYMSLPGRMRKRFWEGEFSEVVEGALFTAEMLDANRVDPMEVPDMLRVVVGVDPMGATPAPGSSNQLGEADRRATGIMVAGLGVDGNAYWMQDCTVSALPAVWGKVVVDAMERHEGDLIVGEVNYGGAMVEHTIRTVSPNVAFRQVRSTRGKHVRAEPVSALMEKGKIRIVGHMRALEDELEAFSSTGYMGDGSPNRADAAIFTIYELFSSLVKQPAKAEAARPPLRLVSGGHNAWMG